MEEKTKEVLASEVSTILEKPIAIEIDIVSPGLLDKLKFKLGYPRKKVFQLRPLVLGNLVRISEKLLSIDMTLFEGSDNILVANYQAMKDHSKTMAEIVAIGITNGKEEPKRKLIQFLLDNMTGAELNTVASHIIKMMDIGSFMNTIISVKGMSLLNPGETIASGPQLAE